MNLPTTTSGLLQQSGPPYPDAGADYAVLLEETCWTLVERIDVTGEFTRCMEVLIEESLARRAALVELLGNEDHAERLQRRRCTLAAVARGLLRREIFLAQRGGAQRATRSGCHESLGLASRGFLRCRRRHVVDRTQRRSRQISFDYQAPAGIALIVLGLGIVVVSIRSFIVAGTTPSPIEPRNATLLVTSGAYSRSRNPMYVGDAVMLAGIAVWIGSVLNLVLIAAFVWCIDRFQIAAERGGTDGELRHRYMTYRSKVRRWL